MEGIDGVYGEGTARAVRAFQFDLLHNDGRGDDGAAPVAMKSFNAKPGGGQYVTAVTGIFDQDLAAALAALVGDARMSQLPRSKDAPTDNQKALEEIQAIQSPCAPTPFVLAIVTQESDSKHFHVPTGNDQDSFVTIGLDRNDKTNTDHITSRGYGIGQYTLFHHPPSAQEVATYIADPISNVHNTYAELREKFDNFVVGKHSADDRLVEHPMLKLRLCRYVASDKRYMTDCKNCAMEARKIDIERGTPAYRGASISYQPTRYYKSASYPNTPDRADFLCDWPYALRRYNGEGVNSYHYQAIVLRNLLQ